MGWILFLLAVFTQIGFTISVKKESGKFIFQSGAYNEQDDSPRIHTLFFFEYYGLRPAA
jgi:hypothetical protein